MRETGPALLMGRGERLRGRSPPYGLVVLYLDNGTPVVLRVRDAGAR